MSTSKCAEIAGQLLEGCLRGDRYPAPLWRELLEWAASGDSLRSREGSDALFRILAEGLADRFERRLCDAYAVLFSEAISLVCPEWDAAQLLARYHRIRGGRRFQGDSALVRRVFVLSRVTLGADIAVTSVALDAAKRRFPASEVVLVGGEKSRRLFDADPRVRHLEVSYGRAGTLRERLEVRRQLFEPLSHPGSIVIDPDSRITQLGLLPLCPEESYYFFESRSYGGERDEPLTALMRSWLAECFGVEDARAYLAPAERPSAGDEPFLTVSLGVGENPAKRIPDPFEEDLVRALASRGLPVWIDKGAGAEEAGRVERAITRAGVPPGRVKTWEGSFAAFASLIDRSRLYLGYDSAGQHAAAACGTPLVSVFAGVASSRMMARWRPAGPGTAVVVRGDVPDPARVLRETLAAVDRLWD